MSAAPGRPRQAHAASRGVEAPIPARGLTTARLADRTGSGGTAALQGCREVLAVPEACIPQRPLSKAGR